MNSIIERQQRKKKRKQVLQNVLIYSPEAFLHCFDSSNTSYLWRGVWSVRINWKRRISQSRHFRLPSAIKDNQKEERMVYSSTKYALGWSLPLFRRSIFQCSVFRELSNVSNILLHSLRALTSFHSKTILLLSRSYSPWPSSCYFSLSYQSRCQLPGYFKSIRLREINCLRHHCGYYRGNTKSFDQPIYRLFYFSRSYAINRVLASKNRNSWSGCMSWWKSYSNYLTLKEWNWILQLQGIL